MKRIFLGLLIGVGLTVASAGPAGAVTVQQWDTPAPQLVNPRDLTAHDTVNGKLVTNVVLPNGYSSRKCWPVMYLLHGTSDSAAPVSLQWLQIGDGALLKMNIPAILVVPGSGDSWWMNSWWNGLRHPAFESWVLQDIVPLVSQRLHVCPGRSEHAIAGLSMGGYGAIYLATQRPDYFGSAGSFSGVLSPESTNFLRVFPTFPTYWGPANKFYAIGHDPVALVNNPRNTRVFVGVGDGVATPGEINTTTAQFEEAEFDQESLLFATKARQAHVSVRFDQHGGTHAYQNWLLTLSHMLAWKPFTHVDESPSSWTLSTVETTGTAWRYKFAFSRYAPPTQIIQFSFSHRVFSARGGGRVTITPPTGKAVTGTIPFDIRNGNLIEIKHVAKPRLVGGYQRLAPAKVSLTAPTTNTGPVKISFVTAEALPRNEEYQLGLETFSANGTACNDTVFTRVFQPAKGKLISANLFPPSTATTPNKWCSGPAYAGVTEVPKSAPPELGNFIGFGPITLP
jgi:S-formylglutathione hydrolase FrmB